MEASSHNVSIGVEEEAISDSWVMEMDKMIGDSDRSSEMKQWSKRYIYRVPAWIKNLHPDRHPKKCNAYSPQLMSLGPFHHGVSDLVSMEVHKHRAVAHLVRRSGKQLSEFTAAVRSVADQLWDAYEDIGAEWEGERFVKLMVTDGCFLLELLMMGEAEGNMPEDYPPMDPVFSKHGYLNLWDTLWCDMIVMENQLPLLLLHTLVTIHRGTSPTAKEINHLVCDALFSTEEDTQLDQDQGLHILDIYHKVYLCCNADNVPRQGSDRHEDMPSAVELYQAGIHFKGLENLNLAGIHFERGVLYMPVIKFYDNIECEFLNVMAFERLHPNAGNHVMDFVYFMDNLIDTAADVRLLCSNRVIVNLLGSDEELATLINKILSKQVGLSDNTPIHDVHRQVSDHCKKPWNKWRATFIHTYFSNPWVFISLIAAVILLVATIMQTVYTIIPFYRK
ncbi:hypothetical protein QOZ80_9BG0711660 [Eleusine coracana subsp. coracana]|nr:hypothetical protein QOZ80_9BG0711660 [Eleusine coracana subsp. coracana]